MIPDILRQKLTQTIKGEIASVQHVSGGSINEAAKLSLDNEQSFFLKWNRTADPDMFIKEERGLRLLDSAHTSLRIPNVKAVGTAEDGTGFLLQEFISQGKADSNSVTKFGSALARLHTQKDEQFGLDHDNYIGRLPQSNKQHSSWIDFFIEERLEPQLCMALDAERLLSGTRKHFESMYERLPEIFPEEPPVLLHGDLWGGNYFYDQNGAATIFDPAVYYGHREIELAFTHLFGGFPETFYKAYEAEHPLEPEFSERKDIYNLYPLLVHTNLFGGSYARQVESIVKQF